MMNDRMKVGFHRLLVLGGMIMIRDFIHLRYE